MSVCLNPNKAHPTPESAPPRLVCSYPNCGFLLAGALIEDWQVLQLLGRGEIADLYLASATAEDSSDRSNVLVKVLHPSVIWAAHEQVEREMAQVLALRHRHIHPLYAAGRADRSGPLYLLSPYEEQGSLARYPEFAASLPVSAVAGIAHQIAEALQYAHDRGVVHGRLKPENCLLVAPGTVQVCDFYRTLLAQELRVTSMAYTAPEQLYGRDEPASDQFALALLSCYLLSAQVSVDGMGAMALTVRQSPLALQPSSELRPDLPRQVEAALQRAASPQPRDRYPSVLAFADALREALSGPPSVVVSVTPRSLPISQSPASQSPSSQSPSSQSPISQPPFGGPFSQPSRRPPPEGVTPLATLPGHTAPVTLLRWAPDGMHLASAGTDGSLRLWRVQQRIGTPVAALDGHQGQVLALSWSPESRLLASAAADATIRVWQVPMAPTPGSAVSTAWWGHDGSVTALAWSPDGMRVASGGADRSLRLWDVQGEVLASWQAHGRGVTALAWSPDGRILASGGADRMIRLWDSTTHAELAAFEGGSDEIRYLAWSPNGLVLASCAGKKDQSAHLWNPASGRRIVSLTGHTRELVGLFWAGDATWLATASADRTLRFWSADQRIGEPLLLPILLQDTPLSMAGAAETGLVALGLSDLLIQVLQLTT